MTQLAELQFAAAKNVHGSNDLDGRLPVFYQTTGNPLDVLDGLETEWLRLDGYSGSLADQWSSYLNSFPFTGALKANLLTKANARELFPQPSPTTPFYLLLEDDSFMLLEDDSKILLE